MEIGIVVDGLGTVAGIFAGGLALGAAGTWFLRPTPTSPEEYPTVGVDETPAATIDMDKVLTDGLITAFDVAGEAPALQAHLVQVLRTAGVQQLEVHEGDDFDPEVHHALGTETGGTDGRIARTVRPGWQSGARVLRAAEVIVWKG